MELRHFLHFLCPDPPAWPSIPHHVHDALGLDRFLLDRAGAVGEFGVVGADVADAGHSFDFLLMTAGAPPSISAIQRRTSRKASARSISPRRIASPTAFSIAARRSWSEARLLTVWRAPGREVAVFATLPPGLERVRPVPARGPFASSTDFPSDHAFGMANTAHHEDVSVPAARLAIERANLSSKICPGCACAALRHAPSIMRSTIVGAHRYSKIGSPRWSRL